MRPYEGLVFSLGKYQYKIKQITDTEVVSVRLDSDGSETSKIKNFLLTQWPPDGASFDKKGEEKDKKKSSPKDEEQIKDMPPHQETDLGEAPDYPSVFFEYNKETKKLEVRDRRNNIKQEIPIITIDGINGKSAYDIWLEQHGPGSTDTFINSLKGQNGKNGKNAYEEWKEWRGTGADTSEEAYWEYFKGQNGKSAFELWKAVHGEKENSTPDDFFEYLKGQDGKDAYEVWQELGYKNGTRQDFFKWIASLVETQKGEDGKIYYPHFDGFTLYFTEDLEGNGPRLTEQDIRGKDGRTYTPKFDGTKLYFDDGENPPTEPVELRGKDAFELWKENHHKPNAKYEEFEDYFKGQNVKADHSYLDIKDFTCPVQTIDTELIANVLDSGKSPDKLIELRQGDIDKLREEGDKRNDIKIKGIKVPYFFFNGSYFYKNWAGWFKEFSWWCAGADRPLLRMCKGDHSKYTGIGTVILFTALMAWFSSFIAMLLVFGVRDEYMLSQDLSGTLAAGGFATFWALMIFFLDRFITNTMYSDGKVSISKDEIIGGLPRILIAIFLGIVISAPLELKIFDKEIETKLTTLCEEELENHAIQKKHRLAELKTTLTTLEISKGEIETRITNNDNIDSLISAENNTHQLNLSNIKKENPYPSKPDVPNDDSNQRRWDTYNSQYEAVKVARAEETRQEDERHNKEIKRLQALKSDKGLGIESISEQIASLQSQIDTLTKEIKNDESKAAKEFDKNKDGLGMKLRALHSIAMEGYTPWFYDEVPENIERSVEITADSIKTTPNNSISNQTDKHMYGAENNKIAAMFDTILHAWWWYLFNSAIGLIMLLFILIDISPVLYKMMLADGVYDNYLHQEKLLAQDKIRLSLARMLRNIEKGELKSLSPFIMGKIYRKLMKYSYSSDSKYNGKEKDYKQHIIWENAGGLNDRIKETNEEVFETVLDYKRRIVLASYAAWYRDMRDAMIGAKDDEERNKINPKMHFAENDDTTSSKEENFEASQEDTENVDSNNQNETDENNNSED